MPPGILANGISGRSRTRRCSRASMSMCRTGRGRGRRGASSRRGSSRTSITIPAVPDQHIEDRMAKEASAWMEKHKDEPFFLNYWMFSVHAPFDAKKALIEKYREDAWIRAIRSAARPMRRWSRAWTTRSARCSTRSTA